MIIGISGISGAGKTTLTKALAEHLNASALFWDDYDDISKPPDDYVDWYHRGADHHEFDYTILAHHLLSLKSNKSVLHPSTNQTIKPTQYIVVDLPMGRAHHQTSQHVDLFIHIDIPLDIALARRLTRDLQKNHINQTEIFDELNYYLKESRLLFTEACNCKTSHTADLIIDGEESTQAQIEKIKNFLGTKNHPEIPGVKIHFTDRVNAQIEKIMRDELITDEALKGIEVNYKKFSLQLTLNNQTIGILNAYTAFSEIYVDDIWVSKPHRHHGYGRLLLKYLEDHFRGQGFNNINLVTSDFQAPNFYKKCGYKAEFKRYNEANPKLTKTFFVNFFGENEQHQGIK